MLGLEWSGVLERSGVDRPGLDWNELDLTGI